MGFLSERVKELEEKLEWLYKFCDICPNCGVEMKRSTYIDEDKNEFWAWKCSNCGNQYFLRKDWTLKGEKTH